MTQYKAYARVFTLTAAAVAISALLACAAPAAKTNSAYALSVPVRANQPSVHTEPLADNAPPEGGYTPVARVADARAASPGLSLRNDAPLRYVVRKGDTLWDISKKFLADAWQWPELWYVNDKIANPHLIYPGDVLELAYVNGRPVLTQGGGGLDRVSPQVRVSSLDAALPAIPIDAIRNFLRGPRLVDAETLNKAPYILSFTDEHIVGATNNGIYIKGLQPESANTWSVVRKGELYRDPETQEVLGFEALPTGETEIRDFGSPAEGVLTKAYREVRLGDRLLPMEIENFEANFYPHSPTIAINGRIISVFDGVSQITQYQIVTLNRGSLHGLEPGHVLNIFQAGRSVVDPYTKQRETLPEQNAGLLMVFKVTPKLSYGLVMTATRPVHVLDRVEKPNQHR